MSVFDLLPDAASLTKVVTNAVSSVVARGTDAVDNLKSAIGIGDKVVSPLNSGNDTKDANSVNDGSSLVPSTTNSTVASNAANINNIDESLSTENGSQYDILYYPEELLISRELDESSLFTGKELSRSRYPHFISILLNVNTKSKLGKYMSTSGQFATKDLENNTLDLSQNTANQALGVSSSNSAASASLVGKTADQLGELAEISKFKRFTGCIMLPIPLNVNSAYNASYNEAGAGGFLGTVLKKAISGGNLKSTIMDTSNELGGAIARDLAKGVTAGIINKVSGFEIGKVTNAGGIFDKVSGQVTNPRTEQVFDKISLRSWKFQWQLNISTVKEWNTIRKIIAVLKENMHPELDVTSEGTYMVMPNEFDIEFYDNTNPRAAKESTTLPKVATSVLTALSVNFTPMGHWIAFEGTMIPPFVVLDVVFSEMEPLHRAMVRDVGVSSTRYSATDAAFGDTRRGF